MKKFGLHIFKLIGRNAESENINAKTPNIPKSQTCFFKIRKYVEFPNSFLFFGILAFRILVFEIFLFGFSDFGDLDVNPIELPKFRREEEGGC